MAAPLDRIARRLRERVNQTAETELFEADGQLYGLPRLSPLEFRRAMRLKAELLREFRHQAFEELYEVRDIENDCGRCLELLHLIPLAIQTGDPAGCRRALHTELKLLHGVGPRLEVHLRRSGYDTLGDLVEHPRWGAQARRLLDEMSLGDLKRLQRLIHRWFPVSHPLGLALLGLVPQERLVLFDVESLGLFGRPIVLLGSARFREGKLEVRQLLARDIMEELSALWEISHALGEEPTLVTYNGRAFDVNFLRERFSYYGLCVELEPVHFDLLPHTRKQFAGTLPDARLETVERHLGLERTIDLPSALVPDFYNTYLETQNIGPLIPIIEHNKYDLIALAVLLGELSR